MGRGANGRSARSTDRAVTLADVARRAGVSAATASFVLSGRAGRRSSGSAQTQEKVRAAAAELGYVPNRNARSLRTGRNGGILLALGTVEDPWGVSLAAAVRDRALPEDLSTLILGDERWFPFLSGSSFDCSFITGIDHASDGHAQLRQLARGTGGIVAFSEQIEPESFDVISSPAEPAVQAAYERLRARHDRVELLHSRRVDPSRRPPYPTRPFAFLDAVQAAGDGDGLDLIHPAGTEREHSLERAVAWLTGPDRPSAVLASTGYHAIALEAAAARAGIRVPDDLEIISIGDIPPDAQLFGQISYYGVENVFDRIAGIILDRALDRDGTPGTLHRFDWEFFPGTTTRD